jgi:hypothetical protein
MDIELNHYEQPKVDAYHELAAARQRGEQVHPDLWEAAKKDADLAIHNAQCRAAYQAELDAKYQAQAAAESAQQEQRSRQEADAHKQRVRAAFPGTPAEFEAAWPKILEAWQVQQALAVLDEHTADARARIRDVF